MLKSIIITLTLILSLQTHSNASTGRINDSKAILAIIGEAESEGYKGMYAVACAIRNRGSLSGVYGLRSYRVTHHKYSYHTYELANNAWVNSYKGFDVTHGATGWGNNSDIAIFKHSSWFSSVYFTAHIGGHWFYNSDG